MAGSPYTVGQVVALAADFSDPDTLEPFDPDTIVFKVMPPGTGATMQLPTPVQDATGQWHADQAVNVPGLWWWRVETSGPEGAGERVFTVNASVFGG